MTTYWASFLGNEMFWNHIVLMFAEHCEWIKCHWMLHFKWYKWGIVLYVKKNIYLFIWIFFFFKYKNATNTDCPLWLALSGSSEQGVEDHPLRNIDRGLGHLFCSAGFVFGMQFAFTASAPHKRKRKPETNTTKSIIYTSSNGSESLKWPKNRQSIDSWARSP